MDPLLQSLVDLQKSLNEQMRLRRRVKAIPAEIEAVKGNRALLEQRREEHREAFKEMEKRERHCEAELADTEQTIRNKEMKLSEVDSNEAYKAHQKEIELLHKKKSDLEEEALILMDRIAEEKKSLEAEQQNLAREDGALVKRIEEMEKESEESLHRIREIEESIPKFQSQILPELLERFKKLYYARDGLAVAPITDGCCGGCQIALSPQTVNAARLGDRIVSCDNCGRILYAEV
jgi:predicted  nucleic acid-binding Zn-ribbon protein